MRTATTTLMPQCGAGEFVSSHGLRPPTWPTDAKKTIGHAEFRAPGASQAGMRRAAKAMRGATAVATRTSTHTRPLSTS